SGRCAAPDLLRSPIHRHQRGARAVGRLSRLIEWGLSPRQQVPRMSGPCPPTEIFGDLPLEELRARVGCRVRAAAEHSAAGAPPQAGAPPSRANRRIVAGISQEMNGHPVGFDFDLPVQPLVLAEFTEEALLDTRRFEPAAVL